MAGPNRKDAEVTAAGFAVPGYQVIKAVGEGTFGVVLQARSLALGRMVAIKVLKPTEAGNPARARFLREAKLLLGTRAEGLLEILDADLEGERPYLVLPFLAGGDLARRIQRGPAAPDEVLGTGVRLARALGALHAKGIVHRDVKPANVLLDEAGAAWLGDLGLGRAKDDEQITATGQMVGTLNYLAPELVAGGPSVPPSDVFALGVVLVELANGRRLGGPAWAGTHLHEALGAVEPKALRQCLAKLVRIRPEDRPADGNEAVAALAAGEAAGSAPDPGVTPHPAGPTETCELPWSASGPRPALALEPTPAPAPRAPAPAPGRGRSRGPLVLSWAMLGVALGLALARSRMGPAPVDEAPAPAQAVPWAEAGFEARFRHVLDELPPRVAASYLDPRDWPSLVRRMPGGREFQDWLAAGGVGPEGLDPALAARLAGLDAALAARQLPPVFGAATTTWPAASAPPPWVPGPILPFPPMEPTGWFAAATLAAEAARPAIAAAAERIRAAARGQPDPEFGELPPTLRLGVVMAEFGSLGSLRSFYQAIWFEPEQRARFGPVNRAAGEVLERVAFAVGQSCRHEPRTREWVAAWFEGWLREELSVAMYSRVAYAQAEALLSGAAGHRSEDLARGALLIAQAEVRERDQADREALFGSGLAALHRALEERPTDAPPGWSRPEAAFSKLFHLEQTRSGVGDLAGLWVRHLAPRSAQADLGPTLALVTQINWVYENRIDRAKSLAPLAAAILRRCGELGLGPEPMKAFAPLERVAALAAPAGGS